MPRSRKCPMESWCGWYAQLALVLVGQDVFEDDLVLLRDCCVHVRFLGPLRHELHG